MKKLITILITLTIHQFLQAQSIDKASLDNSLSLKSDGIYVVNGVPYGQNDSIKLDSVLQSYPKEYIVDIIKLRHDGGIVRCKNNDVAIILFAYQQDKKEIMKKVKILKTKFTDTYFGYSQHILTNSKNPILYIDNQLVYPTEATNAIKKLKSDKIYYIDIKDEPQNTELYGQNAKNGLVRIWTKNKLIKNPNNIKGADN
ncbi:hypothetical protein [uncultured Flavobacterium sp.]|uniref:hypothetical protein n=1 Tax=uncultured Flavobacterium sp. TaxID=165435 RepID=UPI0012047D8A|nr:hypothetical protein [uncultured Flavobacterium sp.]THD33078.1 MAG: hypothetical protein DI588_03840 [Flavobacterium johnsoniae]